MAIDEYIRIRLHENLDSILQDVELTRDFMRRLKTHPCAPMLHGIKAFRRRAKKNLIFLLFANERRHCDLLVQMLQESGQDKAANKLYEFSRPELPWEDSEVPWLDNNKIGVKVVPAKTMRSGHSGYFEMGDRPRGRAVIFAAEPQLKNEVQRWEVILGQIYFDIEVHEDVNCDKIKDVLTRVAREPHEGNSLLVMFIGHGYEEKICGYGKPYGNEMRISHIVDMFSEQNCRTFLNKPKMFLFNCCRVQCEKLPVSGYFTASTKQLVIDLSSIDNRWVNRNTRTYIIYACAEGDASWFDEYAGFTAFGNALTLNIAQFAWYNDFAQLIAMSLKRLEENPEECFGHKQCPEVRMNAVSRQLYLNPGIFNK